MRGEGPGFQGGSGMRQSGSSSLTGGGSQDPNSMRGQRGGAPPMQPPPAPPVAMLDRGASVGQPNMPRVCVVLLPLSNRSSLYLKRYIHTIIYIYIFTNQLIKTG